MPNYAVMLQLGPERSTPKVAKAVQIPLMSQVKKPLLARKDIERCDVRTVRPAPKLWSRMRKSENNGRNREIQFLVQRGIK